MLSESEDIVRELERRRKRRERLRRRQEEVGGGGSAGLGPGRRAGSPGRRRGASPEALLGGGVEQAPTRGRSAAARRGDEVAGLAAAGGAPAGVGERPRQQHTSGPRRCGPRVCSRFGSASVSLSAAATSVCAVGTSLGRVELHVLLLRKLFPLIFPG